MCGLIFNCGVRGFKASRRLAARAPPLARHRSPNVTAPAPPPLSRPRAPAPPPAPPQGASMSDPLLGKIISERYRLTEVLGQGGMGIVFKAEDLRLNNRLCAVKLLKGQTTDPHEAKRFEAELQIISRLRSPHVVQVLDTGYFEGHRLYIVMELLEGEPLSNLSAREGALALPRAIQIAKGILAGLSEAHEFGIVHRDLKPANIFITRSRAGDEITKVLDFGIAKDINSDESAALTSASMIIGTPKYMAPEQFMKQPTDIRTDIYAVGLLLYQLVSGDPPFLPTNDQIPSTLAMMPAEFKVGWLHLNAEARPLGVPEPLWRLIASMLAKDPAARPSSVTDIIDQLNYILSQLSHQTGMFTSLHTPSGEAHADASGGLSSSGPRGLFGAPAAPPAAPQRVAPSLSGGFSAIAAPPYPPAVEATTGVPFVGGQLSSPAPAARAGARRWALATGLLAAVAGVGAWQGGVGRSRGASSAPGACDLTITVARPAQGASIDLKDPKQPTRSMPLQSGQPFRTRCAVVMEAVVRAEGFAEQVIAPIDMREGRSPYAFSVSLEAAGAAGAAPRPLKPEGPAAPNQDPKGALPHRPDPRGRGEGKVTSWREQPAPLKRSPLPARPQPAQPDPAQGARGAKGAKGAEPQPLKPAPGAKATRPAQDTTPVKDTRDALDSKDQKGPKDPKGAQPAPLSPTQNLTQPAQRTGKGLDF